MQEFVHPHKFMGNSTLILKARKKLQGIELKDFESQRGQDTFFWIVSPRRGRRNILTKFQQYNCQNKSSMTTVNVTMCTGEITMVPLYMNN